MTDLTSDTRAVGPLIVVLFMTAATMVGFVVFVDHIANPPDNHVIVESGENITAEYTDEMISPPQVVIGVSENLSNADSLVVYRDGDQIASRRVKPGGEAKPVSMEPGRYTVEIYSGGEQITESYVAVYTGAKEQ